MAKKLKNLKRCEKCVYFKKYLGAEYCSLDIGKHHVGKGHWEESLIKYETFCDRFLSKFASWKEELEYLKKQHDMEEIVELWEEDWDDDRGYWDDSSPAERLRMKHYNKKSIASRAKFINKYPVLNPYHPKEEEDNET
jgi:hypothetical protein